MTSLNIFGDVLGLFVAFLLEMSVNPFFLAVAALACVLGMIRLALYLFNA